MKALTLASFGISTVLTSFLSPPVCVDSLSVLLPSELSLPHARFITTVLVVVDGFSLATVGFSLAGGSLVAGGLSLAGKSLDFELTLRTVDSLSRDCSRVITVFPGTEKFVAGAITSTATSAIAVYIQ